jgi:hypothetical protein
MNLFRIKQSLLVEFLVAFAILVIVRGSSLFNVTWGWDDYLQLIDPRGDGFIAVQASMLRSSISLMSVVGNVLGGTQPTNGSLWSGLHAAGMIIFGLSLRSLWIPRSASFVGIVTTLIFALYPLSSNLWQYQIVHPAMAAFYAAAAYALFNYSKGGWMAALCIIAVAFSLGYQIMLSLLMVAFMIKFAISLVGFFSGEKLNYSSFLLAFKSPAKLLAVIIIGTVIYYLSNKLVLIIFGLGESNRSALASFYDVPQKITILFADLKRILLGRGDPSLPAPQKLVQFVLLSFCIFFSSLSVFRRTHNWTKTLSALVLLMLIIFMALVSIRIPSIFLAHTGDNGRVLLAAGVFWSGIFAVSQAFDSKILRRVGIVLGFFIVSSYAVITSSISADLVRLNQRELLVASRMIERLSQLPNFSEMRTVVVVGDWDQSSRDLRSVSDVLWSSLNSSFAFGVIREASGENIRQPTAQDQAAALNFSKRMPAWPSLGSTAIINDVGVVLIRKSSQ